MAQMTFDLHTPVKKLVLVTANGPTEIDLSGVNAFALDFDFFHPQASLDVATVKVKGSKKVGKRISVAPTDGRVMVRQYGEAITPKFLT